MSHGRFWTDCFAGIRFVLMPFTDLHEFATIAIPFVLECVTYQYQVSASVYFMPSYQPDPLVYPSLCSPIHGDSYDATPIIVYQQNVSKEREKHHSLPTLGAKNDLPTFFDCETENSEK